MKDRCTQMNSIENRRVPSICPSAWYSGGGPGWGISLLQQ